MLHHPSCGTLIVYPVGANSMIVFVLMLRLFAWSDPRFRLRARPVEPVEA